MACGKMEPSAVVADSGVATNAFDKIELDKLIVQREERTLMPTDGSLEARAMTLKESFF